MPNCLANPAVLLVRLVLLGGWASLTPPAPTTHCRPSCATFSAASRAKIGLIAQRVAVSKRRFDFLVHFFVRPSEAVPPALSA